MKHVYLLILMSFGLHVAQAQNLQRVRAFGGVADDEFAYSIVVDSQGSTYTAGFFTSYNFADFDSGPDTFSMLSTNRDAFIVKNDSAGNFIWAKQIGGNSHQEAYSVLYDGANALYVTGSFYGTVDFDPGSAIYNLTAAGIGGSGNFLLKLDTAGNFIWAKSEGITGPSMDLDSSKSIYLGGYFYGAMDFDPGSGVYNLTSLGSSDVGLQKLDSNGNFIWAKRLGSVFEENLSSLKADMSGNLYLTGGFSGALDLNPGTGAFTVNSLGAEDVYVLKLDSSGNYIWGKSFGSQSSDNGSTVSVDSWGNIYVAGTFAGLADFDPGPDTFNMDIAGPAEEFWDIFIQKLDSAGNFVWAKRIGSIYYEGLGGLKINSAGDLYFKGAYVDVVDFDPGPGFSYSLPGENSVLLKLDSAGLFQWAAYTEANISSIALSNNEKVYITGSYSTSVSAGVIVPCNFDLLNTNFSLYGQYPGTYTTDLYIALYSPEPTIILPIQLTAFTATPQQKDVLLEWQTASEIHSEYFIVERSKDASSWSELTRIKAAGSSQFTKDYNTTDWNPYSGTSYYRLKQMDMDGSSSYSAVRKVVFDVSNGTLTVYPNPSNDLVTIQTGVDMNLSELRVLNSVGQDVTSLVLTSRLGAGYYKMDLSKLTAGTYVLCISNAGKTLITKLSKSRY